MDFNSISNSNINNTINNNIIDISFSNIENPLNDSCPITQEDFNENSNVCQINSCKHNFNKNALINWLFRNYTCPICRHNILSETNLNSYNINNQNLLLTRTQFSDYMAQNILRTLVSNNRFSFIIRN